jgi:hypothetical protein
MTDVKGNEYRKRVCEVACFAVHFDIIPSTYTPNRYIKCSWEGELFANFHTTYVVRHILSCGRDKGHCHLRTHNCLPFTWSDKLKAV